MQILSTVEEESESGGSAKITVTDGEERHRFSLVAEAGETALLEHEETVGLRGRVTVANPPNGVVENLMVSEEVTLLLDRFGAAGVKIADPTNTA